MKDTDIIVTDWRAPISSLYYDAEVGKCGFESPNGRINGEMLLKRQYEIENGELQEYFDVDGVGSIPYFVIGENFDNLGYATTEIVEEALKQYQSDDYKDFVAEFIEKGDYNGLKTETLEEACAAKGIKYGANSKNTEEGKLSDGAIVAIIFTVVIVGFGVLVLSSRQQKTK